MFLADIFSKHRENKIISYTDFLMNKDKFFYASYFNWDMNAFEILAQWVPDLAEAIDKIFKLIIFNDDPPYKFTHDHDGKVDSRFILESI